MRINFRQGIVSHQAGGFLTLNPSDNVNLLADNAPVTVTIAQANAQTGPRGVDYLHSENNTVNDAWVGPFVSGTDYWLYWDFDTRTFERTFGFTTLEPVAQSVTAMKSGVDSFAATLAGGMAASGFVGVPPTGYAGISDISSGDKEKGAMPEKLASKTTPWFMSGIAIHMGTGATVPWS